MRPIKLGIIGCGIASTQLHWPALRKLKDKFQITVICNNSEPKAQEFSRIVGDVPYVLDYRDLLKRDDVEAVDIALPIHLNYQVTKDALQAGKHVMVEKPLAANLEQAKQMLEFEKPYPQVKMVAENFYYHPVFQKIKVYIDESKIGEPYAMFWDIFQRLDLNSKYAKTKWRIEHQYPGGFVTDGGIHNIAAIRVMFDGITSGSAFTKSINPEVGAMDSFSFQFATNKNVHGVLNIFRSANGYSRNQLLILGTEGSIVAESAKKIIIKKHEKIDHEESLEDDSYRKEFDDFYQAIRTGIKPVSSFLKAFGDLQILINAFDSERNWQKV